MSKTAESLRNFLHGRSVLGPMNDPGAKPQGFLSGRVSWPGALTVAAGGGGVPPWRWAAQRQGDRLRVMEGAPGGRSFPCRVVSACPWDKPQGIEEE